MTRERRTAAESIGVLLALSVFMFVAALCARLGWALAGRIIGVSP